MPELVRVRDKETGYEYTTALVLDHHEVLKDEVAVDSTGRGLPAVTDGPRVKKAAADPEGTAK